MKKLIVNADDYGLHESINKGIVDGARNGCITSTSIMAVGPAFDHGISCLKDVQELGVGVHLTLVATEPLLPKEKIVTLISSENGMFYKSYPEFIKKYIFGAISIDEIYQELYAQINKVKSAGIHITHLDSHQHLHILPGIIDVVIDLAKHFGIQAVRIPSENYRFFDDFKIGRYIGKCGLTFLAQLARQKLNREQMSTTNFFWGMMNGGNMDDHKIGKIISLLPEGINEIMVHPGYDTKILQNRFSWEYHWEQELSALTSEDILALLRKYEIKLVSFGALSNE